MGFFNDALDQIGLALGGSGALTREIARKVNNGALPPTEQPTRQFDPDFFRNRAHTTPSIDMGDGYLYSPRTVNGYYDHIQDAPWDYAAIFNRKTNGNPTTPEEFWEPDEYRGNIGRAEAMGWGMPWGKQGSGKDAMFTFRDFTPPTIDQYWNTMERYANSNNADARIRGRGASAPRVKRGSGKE